MTTVETRPDVDLADGNFYADRRTSREAYRWMRANQPVFRDRNGLVGATTYQAVIDAERNPELFSNTGGIRPDTPGMPYMIDMDDPAHLLRRKLVNAGFTRKRVTEKEPSIGRLCDALIDAVCERGECDFVRDIAAPLPMALIGDMLGVLPEDRGMLLKWSDDLVTGLSSHIDPAGMEAQAVMNAFAAYTEFTMGIIGKRRAEPTDDLFSILVNAEVEGQRMSDDEIVMETLLILIGGDETTRHTLSGGTEQLVRHRDQWDALVADRYATARGDRGDAALDLTGEKHVPNVDRRHRVSRHRAAAGREDHVDVRVGELRRVDVRERRPVRHPARPQQPRGFWLRHPFLSGQSVGPIGIEADDRSGARTPARSAAGRRWRRIALASSQLRQRP